MERKFIGGRPFQKGVSGNPAGTSKHTAEMRKLCREFTPEALERLVEIMRGRNKKLALDAVKIILDRGHGRVPHVIAGEGGEGHGKIEYIVSWRHHDTGVTIDLEPNKPELLEAAA